MEDQAITFELVAIVFGVVSVAVIVTIYLHRQIAVLRESLSAHKLHAAETYMPKKDSREDTDRVVAAIDKLRLEFKDDMREFAKTLSAKA